MIKIEKTVKVAFTLAETLITVVILGIVAAILVPNLIKNQVENANRTKVKKAMSSYEKAINMMIIENDIKSTENLRELGQDDCQYTREYFKTVQDGSNNCIFKTADRVWWDITDITNPILILKDSKLGKSKTELLTLAKNLSDKTVFAMLGRFDDLGTLRVNDNAYEQGLENNFTNQKYEGKLWYFITQSTSVLSGLQKCQFEGATTCTITSNGISTTYTKYTTSKDTNVSYECLYDRETRTKDCEGHISNAPAGDYWITNDVETPTSDEAKSEETCNSSAFGYSNCKIYHDQYEAAKLKCQNAGGHLATLAELKIAKNNGKLTGGVYYWAAEENYYNYAYRMEGWGNVHRGYKGDAGHPVICIGDY